MKRSSKQTSNQSSKTTIYIYIYISSNHATTILATASGSHKNHSCGSRRKKSCGSREFLVHTTLPYIEKGLIMELYNTIRSYSGKKYLIEHNRYSPCVRFLHTLSTCSSKVKSCPKETPSITYQRKLGNV